MRLYLATGNAHKAEEFSALFTAEGLPVEVLTAAAVGGMPPVEETATDFVGNARLKALGLRDRVPDDGWVLADDSGLCVDYLDGAPGVRSSRYAGLDATDRDNLEKLLDVMRAVPEAEREAAFECWLVIIGPEGEEVIFDGRCDGRLLTAPAGAGGFGYDPIFVPNGYDRTFGELPGSVKNEISHRARALQAFAGWIRDRV